MEENHPSKAKKSKTITFKINRTLFYVMVAVVAIVAAYLVGRQNGINSRPQTSSTTSTSRTSTTSNRWTSVGTVQEISDSKIKIVDSRKQVKEAVINKETVITDRKGAKLAVKDIKKDQRVIVSGTKDEKDDSKLTATRIRLQQ